MELCLSKIVGDVKAMCGASTKRFMLHQNVCPESAPVSRAPSFFSKSPSFNSSRAREPSFANFLFGKSGIFDISGLHLFENERGSSEHNFEHNSEQDAVEHTSYHMFGKSRIFDLKSLHLFDSERKMSENSVEHHHNHTMENVTEHLFGKMLNRKVSPHNTALDSKATDATHSDMVSVVPGNPPTCRWKR